MKIKIRKMIRSKIKIMIKNPTLERVRGFLNLNLFLNLNRHCT